jgi:hypothetical protein
MCDLSVDETGSQPEDVVPPPEAPNGASANTTEPEVDCLVCMCFLTQTVQTQQSGIIGKKDARKLWKWYRGIDMQRSSSIGGVQTSHIWDKMHGIKPNDFLKNQELIGLVNLLYVQYLDGFTGSGARQC